MNNEGQQKTREEMTQKEKEEADWQQMLKEFKKSKDKEKTAAELQAALPPMMRQRSAPLWDHMLNPRQDGSIDPLKLAYRLENNEISYKEAVEEAREYYEKEEAAPAAEEEAAPAANKKKGGRKKKSNYNKMRGRKKRKSRRKKGGSGPCTMGSDLCCLREEYLAQGPGHAGPLGEEDTPQNIYEAGGDELMNEYEDCSDKKDKKDKIKSKPVVKDKKGKPRETCSGLSSQGDGESCVVMGGRRKTRKKRRNKKRKTKKRRKRKKRKTKKRFRNQRGCKR